jgi:hypothetical protein
MVVAGCGTHWTSGRLIPPFTTGEVRHAFAAHDLRPDLTFDGPSATNGEIDRLESTPAGRSMVQNVATTFDRLRDEGFTVLDFSGGTRDGVVSVVIALDVSDAIGAKAHLHADVRKDNVIMVLGGQIKPGVLAAARAALKAL